jgi:sporulation protein YlmC with PRC-barrel domain
MMQLARDLLDNQVIDKTGRRMGRVDDIVLVLRRGKAPRVAWIEMGLSTTLARIHERLGDWGLRLERRLGVNDRGAVRIEIERLDKAGIDIEADVDAERTRAYVWEEWIRRVLIGRIPGHGSGGPEAEHK